MLVYSQEEEEVFFDRIDQVYVLAESEQNEAAEKLLLEIEREIPDPKENCSVGSILLDSIFSYYEQIGELEKALPYFVRETDFLQEKMKSEKILHVVHFITTGSIYYKLQQLDKARYYFKIAYDLGKKGVFADFNPDFLFMAVASAEDFEDFKSNFKPEDALMLGDEELSDEQQSQLDEYCELGNEEMDKESFLTAAGWFEKAYAILPEPKEDWEATGYITASWGDALYCAGKFEEAKEKLTIANDFYKSEKENPFVLLRLGEVHFELKEEKQAIDLLSRAYDMEGAQLFEDDKKFLQFLKKHKEI